MGSPYGPFGTSAAILLVAALFVLVTSVLGCGAGAGIVRLRIYSADLKPRQKIAVVLSITTYGTLAAGVLFFGSVAAVGVAQGWTYGDIETQDAQAEVTLLIGAVLGAFYSVARAVVVPIRSVTKNIEAEDYLAGLATCPRFSFSVRIFALRARIIRYGLLAFVLGWALPAAVLFSNYYEPFPDPASLQLLGGIYLVMLPVVVIKRLFDIEHPEWQMADLLLDLQTRHENSNATTLWKVTRYGPRDFRGTAHRAGWRVAEALERYLARTARKLDLTERSYVLDGAYYLAAQLRTAGRMDDGDCVRRLVADVLALVTRPDQVRTMKEILEVCPRINIHVPVPCYDQSSTTEAATESRIDKMVDRANQFLPLVTDSIKLLGLIGLVVFLTYGLLSDFSAGRLQEILRDLR